MNDAGFEILEALAWSTSSQRLVGNVEGYILRRMVLQDGVMSCSKWFRTDAETKKQSPGNQRYSRGLYCDTSHQVVHVGTGWYKAFCNVGVQSRIRLVCRLVSIICTGLDWFVVRCDVVVHSLRTECESQNWLRSRLLLTERRRSRFQKGARPEYGR